MLAGFLRSMSRPITPSLLREHVVPFHARTLFGAGVQCRTYVAPPPQSSSNGSSSSDASSASSVSRTWYGLLEGGRSQRPNPAPTHESPDVKWRTKSVQTLERMKPPANTYAGRSVPVQRGDVAQAYGRLQARLRRNRVPYEARLQQRHEKRGPKERRLASERWRRRFAHEVRKKVQLVNASKMRGS